MSIKQKYIMMKVRPTVFKWLRESAGYSIDEVSEILKVDPEVIKDIENSKKEYEEIRLSWLRKLSAKYERQLECFFLPEVPKDEENILTNMNKRYYRSNKQESVVIGTHTAKILLSADREARYLRTIIEDDKRIKPAEYSVYDDPEMIAKKERKLYEVASTKAKVNFDNMRNYIERYTIYVFQFDLPLDIIRGFTLVDKIPYIIVINSNDSSNGKLFTLIHEYAHILLRESSYCNIDESTKGNNIETWCNRFTAAFLMPKDQLLNDIKTIKVITDNKLDELSNKYNVSKYALAIRLRNIGSDISDKKLAELRQEAERYVEQKKLENYLFTWEDISIKESKLKEYDKLFDYIIKKKEIKDKYQKEFERFTIKKVIDKTNNSELVKISLNNNCIARIELIAGKKSKLIIEGVEKVYELDVKSKDNGKRHEIYEPIRIPILNKRKSRLGLTYINDLIRMYIDEKISLYELSEYLNLKIDKVKTLIDEMSKNK